MVVATLQNNVKSLPNDREAYMIGAPEQDALDWAALMLRTTVEEGSDAWKWAGHILAGQVISEDRRQRLEKAFFRAPRVRIADSWTYNNLVSTLTA